MNSLEDSAPNTPIRLISSTPAARKKLSSRCGCDAVNTPMLRTGFAIRGLDPDRAVEELNASVPIGRIAEPEDIADVITFLASDAARYMCGALVEVNGGKPVG